MADVSIEVRPPAILQAATSAAGTAEQAAAPYPGVVPPVSAGSPADAAAAMIAAGMGTRSAQLAAMLAPKGPQVQAITQAGVAHMQTTDTDNGQRIAQLVPPMQEAG